MPNISCRQAREPDKKGTPDKRAWSPSWYVAAELQTPKQTFKGIPSLLQWIEEHRQLQV